MAISRPQYPTCFTCRREFTHACDSQGAYCEHHNFTGYVSECDTCRVSQARKFLEAVTTK
jgi:hypothetical protein